MTDPDGTLSLPFANRVSNGSVTDLGLQGYLALAAPGYVPAYFYWGFPFSASQYSAYDRALFTPAALQNILAELGVTENGSRGTLIVSPVDCVGGFGSGVEVAVSTADGQTRAFTTMGVETNITDSAGVIVFLNVPPGTATVTTTPSAIARVSGHTEVIIRAGTETLVLAEPTPLP
jgi:hypothetical protein